MVKCQNCGHENDADADFCEKCGVNLKTLLNGKNRSTKPVHGMNQSTKILVIVCIILVAGIAVTAGALIQMNKQVAQNNTNSTNATVNSTTNQTNLQPTGSNQTKLISASQAMAIADKYAAKFGEKASYADYIDGNGKYYGKDGDPYYHVELEWITPHNYGNSDDIPTSWYVEIDAKTGEINPRG